MLLLFLFVLSVGWAHGEGFVEEVACSSEGLTVVLNKTDADVARWMADPKALPVVYVYDHKTRVPCGTSLKNDKGEINYKLTIPYGKACDVLLADLEPNYRSAETTIALEDNADISISKIHRINHVFCLYARSVQTIRFSDVSAGHAVIASTGGKPKPKVEMMFRNTDGHALRAAKFGDTVEFYVALSPDQAYHGIYPKECMFSDREDMQSPDARRLTFVQNRHVVEINCPVEGMSEVIDSLANVNQEVYFSKFRTFRFGNQSTVFAHCTVQVCLDNKECIQNCFKRVANSNLTADRLRFRHRRSAGVHPGSADLGTDDQVTITGQFTILDTEETREVSSQSLEQCLVTTPLYLLVTIGILGCISISAIGVSTYLAMKMRKGSKDSFELYSAYSSATLNTNALPIGYGHPRHPYAHHLGDNYR